MFIRFIKKITLTLSVIAMLFSYSNTESICFAENINKDLSDKENLKLAAEKYELDITDLTPAENHLNLKEKNIKNFKIPVMKGSAGFSIQGSYDFTKKPSLYGKKTKKRTKYKPYWKGDKKSYYVFINHEGSGFSQKHIKPLAVKLFGKKHSTDFEYMQNKKYSIDWYLSIYDPELNEWVDMCKYRLDPKTKKILGLSQSHLYIKPGYIIKENLPMNEHGSLTNYYRGYYTNSSYIKIRFRTVVSKVLPKNAQNRKSESPGSEIVLAVGPWTKSIKLSREKLIKTPFEIKFSKNKRITRGLIVF